ncbi:MAG: alpha-2-macroglobulin, partial [Lentisphaerae bacterium]|nr:alpha-2-macroglobulin [Lentisphaerota bacterium]
MTTHGMLLVGLLALCGVGHLLSAGEAEDRAAARKLQEDGNYQEAVVLFRKLLANPTVDPVQVPGDLQRGLDCLMRLGQQADLDGFLEDAIAVHGGNWRLLRQAANVYAGSLPHHGQLIGGEFHRGYFGGGRRGRGAGRWVDCSGRDRVRALQLLQQALPLVQALPRPSPDAADFHLDFARLAGADADPGNAWRLQRLTDLSRLPDLDAPADGGTAGGAPVGADGQPVFYGVPASWEAAVSDGERWRWLLRQSEEADPARAGRARLAFAQVLQAQFDVQTLVAYGSWFGGRDAADRGGIFAVDTLKDDETIARLATGVRRFTLPEGQRFIGLLKDLAAGDAVTSVRRDATRLLVSIYENRRQYPEAVTWLERFTAFDDQNAAAGIRRITGNWGQFEPVSTLPAGRAATVPFRFRNARRVTFTAHRVDLARLIADTRAYVRGRPDQLDWQRMNLGDIGHRLVWENQRQYLLDKVAEWTLELAPRDGHRDRRITVSTPLQNAGMYLLVGEVADGNTTRILVVLDDTVIVRKPLDRQHLVFVADAATGQPVPNARLEFLGYRHEWIERTRKQRMVTAEHTAQTNADGMLILGPKDLSDDFAWLITASTPGGRLAFEGFSGISYPEHYDATYEATRGFVITDRPVYRPEQRVQWKAWVAHAKYDLGDTSAFAARPLRVVIRNPRSEAIDEKDLTADAYGGIQGELLLADGCPLGVYSVEVLVDGNGVGQGSFRVEEYKKPEFEVTVRAPMEPVMLGDSITAKVEARYYFGAPVSKGTATVKVLRTDHEARWYPVMPWDWFYGSGYGWFAADYDWYPGWRRWGCPRPGYWWLDRSGRPPEVVAEVEQPLRPDGTIEVTIDTALAKEVLGDRDHRYEITAEVRDESRRTVVGQGTVIAAREAFKVYAWVDRGHYRVGDTVRASFQARTADGKGVAGRGRLRLLRVTYDAQRQPVEREVQTWDLDTDAAGHAAQVLTAVAPGQYRLACQVRDGKGHEIEGGYVFAVRGEGAVGTDFRFSALELVPDKAEYRPGERAEVAVRCDREDAVVLLFTRASQGVCPAPKILRLQGRSAIEEVDIAVKDMPNLFIEALTVADGRVHSVIREMVVPPESRVLGVEVTPSAVRFAPGAKGRVRLRLTEADGRPFTGAAVVSVYDKSVEAIAGGSNVEDIRAFFWKWRRGHHENLSHSLLRWFHNLLKEDEPGMGSVGIFGGQDAENEGAVLTLGGGGMGGAMRRGGMRLAKGMAVAEEAMIGLAPTPYPKPVPAMAAGNAMLMADAAVAAEGMGGMGGGAAGAGPMVQPVVRQEFADTALWVGSLETDREGLAEVDLALPENLTTWKIRVWAMGNGTRVGEGSAEVVTAKDLMVRLQAPRFFVQKDEVVLSANIHNEFADAKAVQAVLELDGPCLEAMEPAARTVRVDAKGQSRVDWRVRVVREGEAVVRMKALSDAESDAMEMRFPVYVHGQDTMVPTCGMMRPEETRAEVTVAVPEARRPESARLEVRFSPSLAMAMVDALPYLVAYPYGCTEQTLNRFLPTVLTQRVLQRLGVSLEEIRAHRANLNAQELGAPAERAAQWRRGDAEPVFDEAAVATMARDG